MRQVINWNTKWAFSKEAPEVPASMPGNWYWVNLPHTWNAIDGQDGDNDYYRGTCYYAKELDRMELPEAGRYYLEIRGANSSADVYVDGKKLAHHDGGYSAWRVDLTEALSAARGEGAPKKSLVVIAVDNSPNEAVYPQMADFTFYGGLYRDVNLIAVSESHFDLDYYGGPGIQVTPEVKGADAAITVDAFLTEQKDGQTLVYTILDQEGQTVASVKTRAVETADATAQAAGETAQSGQAVRSDDDGTRSACRSEAVLAIPGARLWNGRRDPYLYTAKVQLFNGEELLDEVSARFGCRTYQIDPEKGFILNGESYPLRGVSRHQDRWGIGNALLPEHHREDMDLICEMGATTIRLAHYQHDQYFYDLCDERGLVIWAEIPYISKHMPGGRENTITQMKELIVQNYNHASIVVWGLSNEITMNDTGDEDLLENHRILNQMVHEMDPTRLTTLAVVSSCPKDHPYIRIPDVISYNHYFGWYGGDPSMNGPWLDEFHKEYPDIPIGVSEYGCEALNWHTSSPMQGDYTEEYQAYYHEELIKQLYTRPYLWATHVWNMFDFGADARNEGGENGQNHKGLVTFDRKYKKDSFYAYKAWLSDEPFVHICGKRYVDRVEDVTKVTVYSNQPSVELFANGKSLGVQECPEHFFYFQVPNAGETTLTAFAGERTELDCRETICGENNVPISVSPNTNCRDESRIRKVEKFNEAYRLREKGAVLNWFDVTAPEGFLSLNDKVSAIQETEEGKGLLMDWLKKLTAKSAKEGSEAGTGENSQSSEAGTGENGQSSEAGTGENGQNGEAGTSENGQSSADAAGGNAQTGADESAKEGGLAFDENMMKMLGGFSVLRLNSMMGMFGTPANKEQLLELNEKLNKIAKTE